MKWSEYRREIDALEAPASLKACLAAMAPQAQNNAFSYTASVPGKRIRNFPWKRAAALVACLAIGVMAGRISLLGLPSLTRSSDAVSYDAGPYDAEPYGYATAAAEYDTATGAADSVTVTAPSADNRKIIYNASISLESKEYDTALSALQSATAAANGYIESSDESRQQSLRNCSLECRIPVDQYDAFLAEAEGAGNVTYKKQSVQDITASYVDVQARIDALNAQQSRLAALQQQADTLSDLLQIEDSMSNVQYQLESYTAQQKAYDDQIDYSTVSIELSEVESLTPTQTGFWQQLGTALAGALGSFSAVLAALIFWVAGIWPWLAVAGILFVAWHFLHKRRGAKK